MSGDFLFSFRSLLIFFSHFFFFLFFSFSFFSESRFLIFSDFCFLSFLFLVFFLFSVSRFLFLFFCFSFSYFLFSLFFFLFCWIRIRQVSSWRDLGCRTWHVRANNSKTQNVLENTTKRENEEQIIQPWMFGVGALLGSRLWNKMAILAIYLAYWKRVTLFIKLRQISAVNSFPMLWGNHCKNLENFYGTYDSEMIL